MYHLPVPIGAVFYTAPAQGELLPVEPGIWPRTGVGASQWIDIQPAPAGVEGLHREMLWLTTPVDIRKDSLHALLVKSLVFTIGNDVLQ